MTFTDIDKHVLVLFDVLVSAQYRDFVVEATAAASSII